MGPINKVTSIGLTGSYNSGKTDSTYASVADQTGVFAGKGGFDITVGKNTDLKGAFISSTATLDKNKISTDKLTWSDIQNKAEYDSSSSGIVLIRKVSYPSLLLLVCQQVEMLIVLRNQRLLLQLSKFAVIPN